MEAEELNDRQGIFFIGFGNFQGQLSEVRDKLRVYSHKREALRGEGRKEVDVITSCGFHASDDIKITWSSKMIRFSGVQRIRRNPI